MEQDIISNYVFLEKQELAQNTIYLYDHLIKLTIKSRRSETS